MRTLIRCARALVGGEERNDYAFVIEGDAITLAGTYPEIASQTNDCEVRSFPANRLVVPGFVNGHSHAYQILLRGWGDDLPFATWRSDALYKVVPNLTPDDVYWTFVAAFSEMLAAGITTVAEFFYLNGGGNAHAIAAIQAARETGIRLVLARTWMDADYAPAAFRETIEQAATRTAELKTNYPHANVCVAPHSLHATSHAMIQAAAAFAREYDTLVHIHVAEAEYEGAQTLAAHGATPIALLDRLGVLDDRLLAVHAIYLNDEEKQLLADRGTRVVHNPMTNQYLGDGTCDLVGLRALGVRVGLGTDADVKPSIIDEMRAAALLQKLAARDGAAFGARDAFALGTSLGAEVLGVAAGELTAGNAADFAVLGADGIDPWSPAVNAVVYRGQDAWTQATFVGGKRVYFGEPSAIARKAREELASIAHRLLQSTSSGEST